MSVDPTVAAWMRWESVDPAAGGFDLAAEGLDATRGGTGGQGRIHVEAM